ncbi:vWA domain-containing protein [Paenisporosarcina sp.]|uniref:vWA domain-containing protein n=1 Tax=Paenisporosarcina sp. TaxID=1932001 RepID=UPI003C7820C3
MSSVNRFIQFNNETINAKRMIQLEQLARALSRTPYLTLTVRKLMEFRPKEGAISISHFWQHRDPEVEQNGQLSDLYLLTAGYWRHFNQTSWNRYKKEVMQFPLKEFALQLALSAEEFRLSNLIRQERPGTDKAFSVREDVYTTYHEQQMSVNLNKGFISDSLFNYLYLSLRKGSQAVIINDDIPGYFQRILSKWQFIYDAKSTADCCKICLDILYALEEELTKDLTHTFLTIHENLLLPAYEAKAQHQIDQQNSDEQPTQDSIEEMFRAWHRESEKQAGPHLEFELSKGNKGKTDNGRFEEGDDANEIQSEGIGSSHSNKKSKQNAQMNGKSEKKSTKHSGERFGDEHQFVTIEEKRIVPKEFSSLKNNILTIRAEQKPYVKAFTKEMRKRIDQKLENKRSNLSKGRLTPNLTSLLTEQRPKPFYKKNNPSLPLDAVFGLLVDSSASMIDKMDETKKAVLLFHDVLRDLGIRHDIVSYYEDAYEASELEQPNSFLFCHQVEDGLKDHAAEILSLEAHEDNRDGLAIRWMAERLQKRHEKHKFLLLFSDGEPSAYGYAANGIVDTAEAVIESEKKGIHILHLYLSATQPVEEQLQLFKMMFGPRTATARNVDEFTTQTLRLLRRMLYLIVK